VTWKLERKGTAKEEVMTEPTMETLARRLDRLERENRLAKVLRVKVGNLLD